MVRAVLMVVYLTLGGTWTGSMAYSLGVVQPRVDRFFADERRREEFLVTLAHGNRWRVVALIAALVCSGVGVVAVSRPAVVAGYGVALGLDCVAAALFVHVSWRHWPARVFALPEELAGYRHRLRVLATTMTVLVGAGFLGAAGVSVAG